MALSFAVTTSTIVLLYGAWSSYVVLDTLRDDIKEFMQQELNTVAAMTRPATDSDRELIKDLRFYYSSVERDTPCAYRVRDADGLVMTDVGPKRLLTKVDEPITEDLSWRHYFDRRIAVAAKQLDDPAVTIEVIVSLRPALAKLREYLGWAFAAFLFSVLLAGLAGWVTAHRGLRGLREVATQARDIGLPDEGDVIRVHNAPHEIREVGRALNAMLNRIRHSLTDLRTFTAGLAHELRSPLQNLIGETEVTLLKERTNEEYRQLLKSNLEDLLDLSDAVDNLVAYCHTNEPEKRNLRAEYFDLATEAEFRIARLKGTADRMGVTITLNATGDTGLYADRESCLRVLRNLVGNAITWSPTGGEVRVDITGDENEIRLDVEDDGPGVPESLGERIFQPFVSGQARAGHRGGYGLGLTICRMAMDDHGGRLGYVNRGSNGHKKGARFTAVFPRLEVPSNALDAVPAAPY